MSSIEEIKTWNKKEFISKKDMHSSSMIHSKLYPDGRALIRISDCNGSIRWHNYINQDDGLETMIEKLDTAIKHMSEYKEFLEKERK